MKRTLFPFFFFLISMANAQVGVNTTNPDPSSILDVTATGQGFLKPRMTSTQREAIPSPATGLEVYDTTTNTTWYYNGTIWVNMEATSSLTGSNSIIINGNAIERAALSGDVIAPSNNNTTTISNNAVTSSKILDGTILGEDLNQMSATLGQFLSWNGTTWAPASANQGTVTSVTGTTPIQVSNNTTTPTISLSNSGVAPGTYNSITVNAQGLVTSASNTTNAVSNNVSGNNLTTTVNTVTGTPITIPNIYTSNGTLTGNRTVTQGANTLSFTGTSVNAFSVDGSTFSVDALNNRVGIGQTNPSNDLEIISQNDSGALTSSTGNLGLSIGSILSNYRAIIGAVADEVDVNTRYLKFNSNWSGSLRAYGFFDGTTELFNIYRNGNVGIGINSPTSKLDVFDNSSSSSRLLKIGNNAATFDFIVANNFNNTNFGSAGANYAGNGQDKALVINHGGDGVVIFGDNIGPWASNAYDLGFTFARWQRIYLTNAPNVSSDIRLKSNINSIPYGLEAVMKLAPKIYEKYGNEQKTGKSVVELGFIAQELKQVVPEVVKGDENKGLLGVQYENLIPVLTKAIQEQQKQIEEQQKLIDLLLQRVTHLEKK